MSEPDFTYTPPGQNSPEHRKRMFIAMILMMVGLFFWDAFFSPTRTPQTDAQSVKTSEMSQVATSETGAKAQDSSPAELTSPTQSSPVQPAIPEKKVAFQTKSLDLEFSNVGGGISRAVLKNNDGRWNDYKFEQTFEVSGKKEIRAVDLAKVLETQRIPGDCEVSGDGALPFSTHYEVSDRTDGVSFRGNYGDVSVEKSFRFSESGYDLRATYKVTNKSTKPSRLKLSVVYPAHYAPELIPSASLFAPPPDQIQAMLLDDGSAERLQATEKSSEKSFKGPIQFVGFDQRYFLGAIFPADQSGTSGRIYASKEDGTYEATLIFDLGRIEPGQSVSRDVGFFIGPKSNALLNEVSEAAQRGVLAGELTADSKASAQSNFANPRLAESIDFGWWAAICRMLLFVLNFFASLVHNWGVAIILLTLMVKLLLFPLNQKQMASMEAMRRIQPQLQELQKKYANDRERLGIEQMKLFQENHANPFGGCLPLLIQMPVWFALYRTLYSSFELYREPLLSFWITDLTQGDPFYILPLAMGATMFITQKMQPQMGDPKQAKMMLYIMPIFFTALMFNLPAGLTLYIFTNNLLSIAQQSILRRKFKRQAPVTSGSPTTIDVVPSKPKETKN